MIDNIWTRAIAQLPEPTKDQVSHEISSARAAGLRVTAMRMFRSGEPPQNLKFVCHGNHFGEQPNPKAVKNMCTNRPTYIQYLVVPEYAEGMPYLFCERCAGWYSDPEWFNKE
jgi:hypothetical protein